MSELALLKPSALRCGRNREIMIRTLARYHGYASARKMVSGVASGRYVCVVARGAGRADAVSATDAVSAADAGRVRGLLVMAGAPESPHPSLQRSMEIATVLHSRSDPGRDQLSTVCAMIAAARRIAAAHGPDTAIHACLRNDRISYFVGAQRFKEVERRPGNYTLIACAPSRRGSESQSRSGSDANAPGTPIKDRP